MGDPNVGEWVPVETQDTAGRIRGDYGALCLDGLSWAYLTASQWEALKAAGDRLLAGMRGRRAAGMAEEAGTAGHFADLVAATFPFPDAPGVNRMSDADWAHVARVLRDLPGSWPLLRDLWEQAAAEAEQGTAPGEPAGDGDGEASALRTVTIPASQEHNGLHSMLVTLPWTCPQCGGPRGEPYETISYDGSRRLGCDGWDNPCGHVDGYSAVRQEARTLAAAERSPEPPAPVHLPSGGERIESAAHRLLGLPEGF